MRTLALLALLALTGCSALAPKEDWTSADTRRELAFQGLNVVDALQTARIRDIPGLSEYSPLTAAVIGRQPKPEDVAWYFTTQAVSHYLISRALPARWRRWWQGGTAGFTLGLVVNNCHKKLLCGGPDVEIPLQRTEEPARGPIRPIG